MWIKRVEIAGFGQFKQREFELADGLQVIYGANESGKSTLRAFILGMLFGFPSRRHPLERYEPKETSQYGGALDLVVDGTVYRLTRLGDQPATLVNLTTGAAQPMALLEKWLAPYDQTRYKQLFTFNQAELTALRTLSPADLNAQLQQVGLVGSAPWRATKDALRTTADELYKPRGRKPELNAALKRYQQLSAQVAAAGANYEDYQRLQAEIQHLQSDQTRLQRAQTQLNGQQQRLANLRNQWPVYQQLQRLTATSGQADAQLSAASVQQYQTLAQQRAELQHTLASARQQLSEQPVDDESQGLMGFYVQHQTEFEALEAELPTLQQALGQAQTLAQQAQTAQSAYDAQQAAHPELMACLAPSKRTALAQLKVALADEAPTRQQQTQHRTSWDWRLPVGGVALVAGIFLPLGGFKWLLIVAGLVLLGRLGYEELSGHPTATAATSDPLAERLTALGLPATLSPNQAREQLELIAALQRAQTATTHAQQQLAAQHATVWRQLEPYQFAANWVPVDQQDLAGSVQRVTAFYERLHQLMQRQTMAGPDFAYTQRQVQQLTERVRQVTGQLQALAERNQLADVDALAQAVDAQAVQTANTSAAAQLEAQLPAADRTALAAYASVDALQAEMTSLRQQQADQQEQLTAKKAALVTAQTQLNRLTEDGRYTSLRQQQADLQTEITVMARQWLTRQLGAQWIETALQRLTDQQLPAVLERASAYFAQLTLKRYNKISLNGSTLVVLTTDQRRFAVAELSTATKEQLYLAVRLALIAHLGPQAQLPLMIDDGLVNFDVERRRAAWQLLATVAGAHQLLYFTNEPAARTAIPGAAVYELA